MCCDFGISFPENEIAASLKWSEFNFVCSPQSFYSNMLSFKQYLSKSG